MSVLKTKLTLNYKYCNWKWPGYLDALHENLMKKKANSAALN